MTPTWPIVVATLVAYGAWWFATRIDGLSQARRRTVIAACFAIVIAGCLLDARIRADQIIFTPDCSQEYWEWQCGWLWELCRWMAGYC